MSLTRLALGVVILAVATPLATTPALGDSAPGEAALDWPQWRGPARDGSAPGGTWPDSLKGLTREWRVDLGKGYSGPIVTADRVFVVETADKTTVGVRALARDTGAEIWSISWPGKGDVPFFAARNGDWVRSTPAFDGETLYVGDMQEVLVALDGDDGKERWRVDFPARFETPVPDFGFASSPLVDGEFLYLQAANSLVKLRRKDGSTVWRALAEAGGMTSNGAFSSPIIAAIDGVRQVVVQTRATLAGVALDDGAVLWSTEVPNFRGMNILTPVVHDDAVFTSSYKNASWLYSVSRNDDTYEVGEVWANKAAAYMSSPVVIDGHAYLHLGNGRLDCIDLATGESRWRSDKLGSYWSLTWQGDKILGLDADGMLYLVRANHEKFELLDSKNVSDEETWAHLAVSGDRLFVRELKGISAWRIVPTAP